ncbi:MAG: ADP-glyceromanno-heptose 6-epimerase [Puniceicoccales bacterium]|jgi:ADP-L-glycero-D-manno-heptose 6-epimerase|nr:ADP-glyceromanno-heptose 6-epimerase [Puniceicoccales bacterium]
MRIGEGSILVTGGAGLIGSALIWALNNLGVEDIVLCERLSTDDRYKNLIPLHFHDYVDGDDLMAYLGSDSARNIRTIFHLGACADTMETDGRFLMKNNFEFTKNLAHYAEQHKIRFVYASSAATYGDGSQGMEDNEALLYTLRPLNMYGYSKHLFDIYAQTKGMKLYGMKYFNVFGPNEYHKAHMISMVVRAYEQIQSTGQVKLFKSYRPEYADGYQKRDFLYVKDAVDMTIFLGNVTESIDGRSTAGIYNIGSGEANTWLDLLAPIFEVLQKPQHIQYIEMPENLRARYQYYTCGNIRKLHAIGYKKPIMPLQEAVKDYVANYLIPSKRLGE